MSAHVPRRAWRVGQMQALIGLLTVAGVLAGCASPTAGPTNASPARSHAAGASTLTASRIFSSRLYGYTVALPAGWSGTQAVTRTAGTVALGFDDGSVDLFHGPPNVVAWAFAVPPVPTLTAYATATARAAAELACQPVTPAGQQITIAGVRATMLGTHCPSPGGYYVLTAIPTRQRAAMVFAFEDSSGDLAAEHADRVAFTEFLTSIRFKG
jgi:hypothetical protein